MFPAVSIACRRLGVLGALGFALLGIVPASAQVIATYDFENSTTQGWSSFNGATVAVSTAASESGAASLLVTTNASGAGGPGISVTSLLVPGATYQISGWAMLTTGENATNANFTMQRTDASCAGGACYDTVGPYQTPVSSSGWAQLTGQYTVPMTATALTLYAQLIGPTTTQSFYLDNVVINQISGPPGGPQDNSGISTGFEDGGLDGWSSRAGCVLTNTTADAHTGTHSLLITGRTAAYDGPQISVSNKMYNGSAYSISVWVKLGASATAADTLRVSLQTTLAGTTTYHTVIGNTPVPLGSWVHLSIPTYSMAFAYDPGGAFLYVESNSGTQDFYIDDFQLTFIPPIQIQTDIPSIYQTLADDFTVGAAVDAIDLSGVHAQLLAMHFNSVTSENDMKWSSTEPTEGHFTFAAADAQVAFAEAHSMKIRGHNLVWANGSQVPAWVFLEPDGVTPLSASSPADVTLLTNRIVNHINGVMNHFGNAVYAWDVVNEPLDPNQPDCLNHGPFYQILGASYLDIAFQAARAANPSAELFLNDFSTTDPPRRACLVQVVRDLQHRGIPIDGVGHEMHNAINYPSLDAMEDTLEAVARLHVDQQITELDMSVYNAGDNTSDFGANGGTVPPAVLAQQGYLYDRYFRLFRHFRHKISNVTFWGMADDDTWLSFFPIRRLNEPLPFDQRLQAKPAYWGIVDPTQLPGYNLTFALSSKTGPRNARVWTVTASDAGPGTAYTVQIDGFNIQQVGFKGCVPTVTPSAFPIVLGDIAEGSTASASFTIDFTKCRLPAPYVLSVPWSQANGADTGKLRLGPQQP
jgi:endo-1,4-beta-xylanase